MTHVTHSPGVGGGAPRLIALPEVIRLTSLSRSSIYALARQDRFPKPVPLGVGARVAWIESEVLAFVRARIAEARGLPGGSF